MVDTGMAGGLPNWNMEPMAGVKLAPEAGGAPKRKGCAVEVVALVTLLTVLVTLFTPKPKAGLEAESADVLAVVVEATVEVAVARPVKRGAVVAAAVAGVVVCLKKGPDNGTDGGSPVLLKTGGKVRAEVLAVVGRVELEDAVVVTEGLDGSGPSFSLLGGMIKMGLNMGDDEDTAGATGEGGLEGGVLSIPNRKPCLGMGDGADGAWGLADVSARRAGGDLVSVTGIVEEAGTSPMNVTVDFESAEVPGRGPDCEEPRGARRLGVFGDEWASVVATPADSGKDGRPGEFCIFFKLSNSGLVLGAGMEAGEEAAPAAGRVKVNEG